MKITVLSKAPFPEGNASSAYILNVCRVLTACGHEVKVCGCLRSKPARFSKSGVTDGIRYSNFPAFEKKKIFVYLYDRFWKEYLLRLLKREEKPDLVLFFDGMVKEVKAVSRYCKKHGILYGAFNCEWYAPECFSSDVKKSYVNGMIGLIPFNATHADVAVLISTVLTDYFRKNGVKSIMIPNIVDLSEEKWRVKKELPDTDVLRLAYAGVPGEGKDELGTVAEAMSLLSKSEKKKVELHVFGSTETQLKDYFRLVGVKEIPDGIICHGRKAQHEVPALLNTCHYTVLIRKPTRRNNAGFSTKMVESFAAGIPMIANLTGDIGTYLTHGKNGVVVRDESAEACRDALLEAITMLPKNSAMREAAYNTAEEHFDYRSYIPTAKAFFESIEQKL